MFILFHIPILAILIQMQWFPWIEAGAPHYPIAIPKGEDPRDLNISSIFLIVLAMIIFFAAILFALKKGIERNERES